MNLVACVWLDRRRVYFGSHASERFRERMCPEEPIYRAINRLRTVAQDRGSIRLDAPKGIQLGRELRHQYLTDSWLVIPDEPAGGVTALPLVIKPGTDDLVATTCIVRKP